jgi:hypothetical protein
VAETFLPLPKILQILAILIRLWQWGTNILVTWLGLHLISDDRVSILRPEAVYPDIIVLCKCQKRALEMVLNFVLLISYSTTINDNIVLLTLNIWKPNVTKFVHFGNNYTATRKVESFCPFSFLAPFLRLWCGCQDAILVNKNKILRTV